MKKTRHAHSRSLRRSLEFAVELDFWFRPRGAKGDDAIILQREGDHVTTLGHAVS